MRAAALAFHALLVAATVDPFAFFQPSVSLTVDERQRLDRGEAIARTLSGQDREVAVFAAVRVHVDGDRLVAWVRRIEELKRSSYVTAIGRFSEPPRIADLEGLALDDEDLSEIQACRPARCGLHLSANEINDLQRAASDAGKDWKPAVQRAFRGVLLARVAAYRAGGQTALAPYENRLDPVSPDKELTAAIDHSAFLAKHVPQLVDRLMRYPREATPNVESFFYWSKERLAGRTIVDISHVSILRSADPALPDALVAGKEIFATRYVTASLGVTAIMPGGSANYLVYVNRSEVDVFGGIFGGLVRWFVERRVRAEAGEVLSGLRQRLEGGEPPVRDALARSREAAPPVSGEAPAGGAIPALSEPCARSVRARTSAEYADVAPSPCSLAGPCGRAPRRTTPGCRPRVA